MNKVLFHTHIFLVVVGVRLKVVIAALVWVQHDFIQNCVIFCGFSGDCGGEIKGFCNAIFNHSFLHLRKVLVEGFSYLITFLKFKNSGEY